LSQQLERTLILTPGVQEQNERRGGQRNVVIAAVGTLRRVEPGRTLRQTLKAEGIDLPESHQTLRVNHEVVHDLDRVLQDKDKVTIVDKVVAGWR